MAFPVTPPVLTQDQSIVAITESESGIVQCMADFLCNQILPEIKLVTDVENQVELSKSLLNAYACKENSVAEVVESLANTIWASKGLVPDCDCNDNCNE